jgi:hypothetical protein
LKIPTDSIKLQASHPAAIDAIFFLSLFILGRKADGAKALFAFLFLQKKKALCVFLQRAFLMLYGALYFFVQELPTTSRIG